MLLALVRTQMNSFRLKQSVSWVLLSSWLHHIHPPTVFCRQNQWGNGQNAAVQTWTHCHRQSIERVLISVKEPGTLCPLVPSVVIQTRDQVSIISLWCVLWWTRGRGIVEEHHWHQSHFSEVLPVQRSSWVTAGLLLMSLFQLPRFGSWILDCLFITHLQSFRPHEPGIQAAGGLVIVRTTLPQFKQRRSFQTPLAAQTLKTGEGKKWLIHTSKGLSVGFWT